MNPRKSLAERELTGNPGKRPEVARPRAAPGEPDVPDEIMADDFARAEWFRITSILRDEGRLTQYDGGMIETTCQAFSMTKRAYAEIAGKVVVPGDRGMVKNPAVQIWRESRDGYQRGCDSLGVSPGKRDVVKAEPAQDAFGQLD